MIAWKKKSNGEPCVGVLNMVKLGADDVLEK